MAVLSMAPLQFVASIPPVTRAFTALTIAFSLLYYWMWWTSDETFSVPYLVLVPGSSFFYPWTFVTSAFVETGVLEVRMPCPVSYMFNVSLYILNSCCARFSLFPLPCDISNDYGEQRRQPSSLQ